MALSRLSVAILIVAVVLAVGLFGVSRNLNQRDNLRLLTLQAGDAKTSVTSLLSVIDSDLSSVGAVAAATDATPASLNKLATAIPALSIFSTLTVLHNTPGATTVVTVRGNPGAPLGDLGNTSGKALSKLESNRGLHLIGFYGQGAQRRLAVSVGAPAIPAGYFVYTEVPLPAGTTFKTDLPGLDSALYLGPTESAPVVFSSTKTLPLGGQRVTQLVDPNDIEATTSSPAHPAGDLLFVVSSRDSLVGGLASFLPWILLVVMIMAGILVAFVVESTGRRRDSALRLVRDLEQKNAELDRAMAEQAEAEKTRIRLEGELRQAQRLEAIGQLAGGVAHDFNNLLMIISSHSEFMAEELPDDHDMQEDLAEVRHAAQRAAELTRQLLVFSRRDLVKPSVIDVNASIADVVNLLRRTVGEDVQLKSVLASDLPRILCDAGELQQVLMNLVVNARQALEVGGGTITVETSDELIDEDAASVHAELQPGRYVRINVTDTGCGMSSETASRIFEPYFTTKAPGSGTGLGLSTVYGIASRYGGYVTVYSEVDVGTTFKVYLPTTDEKPETAAEDAPNETPSRAQGTILVVEDEEGVRNACRRILERAGFKVIEASDGAEALSRLDGLRIDLLLTDVVMPGGMTGRDLAWELEQLRPGVPVLFMSGYNADAIATRGVLEPGISVIEKPFTSADLTSKIHELLSSPSEPDFSLLATGGSNHSG
jgi:signal transduction histidine kinase/CheY-like chemotaxis protein